MLNITNPWGNESQNHKIAPHAQEDRYYQETGHNECGPGYGTLETYALLVGKWCSCCGKTVGQFLNI